MFVIWFPAALSLFFPLFFYSIGSLINKGLQPLYLPALVLQGVSLSLITCFATTAHSSQGLFQPI